MANLVTILPVIGQVLAQAAAFEAGSPITIPIPEESTTLDAGSLGKIVVTESGTTLTIKKA